MFMYMPKLSDFTFSEEKSRALSKERGLGFEEIVAYIEAGNIVDDFDHLNQKEYPNQRIYAVNIEDYIWLVPYQKKGNVIHLITAFPSRKAYKVYIGRRKKP